jgi:integrase
MISTSSLSDERTFAMKRSRNPRFLKQYRDPAGNWINQYRRNGRLVRLPNGRDFNDEFWQAYYAAERAILTGEVQSSRTSRVNPGTVDAALAAYYRSGQFLNLAANTRRTVRTSLERDFRPAYGDARIAHLLPRHVATIVDEKAASAPAGAKVLLTALKGFTRYCLGAGLVKSDPAVGIQPPKHRSEPIHTWTEAQIAQFEARWSVGSQPRLAMGLHLYTGQRLSDTTRMGAQHVRNGMIHITQVKTGTPVSIPIHSELQRILDAVPKDNLTFLLNGNGAPFVHGYGARFREWCSAAGLPAECTSHGLRKAACRRLAEAGCTVHEIAAISGHKTLHEIERYTRAVDREQLARRAIAALAPKTRTMSV